jgi:ribosome assembly protein YihI (activator of Der GTPase)
MASPASSANSASGSGSKREERIGDLMLRLGIEDDEFDDVVFEEEETAPK